MRKRRYPRFPTSLKAIADATQSEDSIQIRVMEWWAIACRSFSVDARLLQHTPNGGKRGIREAVRFKRMGVRAGWPDLFLAVPRSIPVQNFGNPKEVVFNGLFVEMKKADGRIDPAQKELHALLTAQGYAVMVAWSFDEAVTYISNYLTSGDAFSRAPKGGGR